MTLENEGAGVFKMHTDLYSADGRQSHDRRMFPEHLIDQGLVRLLFEHMSEDLVRLLKEDPSIATGPRRLVPSRPPGGGGEG